jgi:hypothetical protein
MDVMDISPELIADIWDEYQRHVAAIRMVGGIALVDAMNGREVPKGWVLDAMTDYYVPPNFITSTTVQ